MIMFARLVFAPAFVKLGCMKKLDVKLRQHVFSSLSDAEREEAGRILRAYLAECSQMYELSEFKSLLEKL
jgi:hypothetical protein